MNTDSLRPNDVDPGKFHKALWIYFLVGIVGITVWQFWRHKQESAAFNQADQYEARIDRDFAVMASAIRSFREDQGREPRTLNEIVGFGGLVEVPIDPWSSRPYRYWTADGRLGIYTLGADQETGGERWDRDQEIQP